MIVDEKSYEDSGVWTKIPCKCDYCGIDFERSKRNLKVGRTIIVKDSCNSKSCVQQKRTESQLFKYGVENFGGTEESKKKAKLTWMKNLGVENPAKSKDVMDKQKKTCLTRYGKTSFLATDSCKESLRRFSLENYGVENIGQSEEIKEKIKKTCIEKYGVDHPRKNKKCMEEFCKCFFEKYGVNFPNQMENHSIKKKKTCIEKYGVDHPVKNIDIQNKIRNTCIEKYGKYPVNCFGETESYIKNYIFKLGFVCKSDRSLLNGSEIDIYIPEKKIGIEYCGLFWHNEMSPCPRDNKYHYNKYKHLQEKGIRLVTIFEDEWLQKQDICKSILSSILGKFSCRIYARNTLVKEIDKLTANEFLENNHLQGKTRFLSAGGLFHENKLVAVVTYGKHHRQNQKGFVISRFCSLKNTQIVGGISKLFSFVKNKINSDARIITWSDNRWSNGDIYDKLGFNLEENLLPDYSYYKYGSHAKRKSKQSMKKSNTGCPSNITEKNWCLENGYVRIWDCGKIRWSYDINKN